jgi:phosphoglycerate dehydrogenase-like enzyme
VGGELNAGAPLRAVLHYRISAAMRERLCSALPAGFELMAIDDGDLTGLQRALADADVLLHVLAPATASLIESAPRLKLIQKIGVGINTIDLAAAKRCAVRVANMPGSNSQAVCEMTLGLMLAAMRRIVTLDAAVRAGSGWDLPLSSMDAVCEIAGKTVGLIGYGEVPRRLAPVLLALGARVLVHRRQADHDGLGLRVELDRLLAESDIVSLHLPLTDSTRHLLDAKALASMKPGVVVVNTARGALIDEQALHHALVAGHVRAAGLDVFEHEPATHGNPLHGLGNVVLAPHVAWLTPETLDRSAIVIAENCRRLLAGERLQFEIDL